MKKISNVLMMASLVLIMSCNEQKEVEIDAPKQVVAGLNAKYPDATDIKWITEDEDNKTIYEAKFKVNGKSTVAEFESDGSFIKEE